MKRITRQQEAIIQVLLKETHPLTAYEILNRSVKAVQSINLSTIYRNLKYLLEKETIRRIEIPGDTPRYEIKDSQSYNYFLCDACMQVFRWHSKTNVPLESQLQGFLIKNYSVSVYGTCCDCKR